MWPPDDTHENVRGSVNPKLDPTQMRISRGVDKFMRTNRLQPRTMTCTETLTNRSQTLDNVCWLILLLKFFLSLFIYFERDRVSMSRGGAERERERERIPSRFLTVSAEPDAGPELTNHEIVT